MQVDICDICGNQADGASQKCFLMEKAHNSAVAKDWVYIYPVFRYGADRMDMDICSSCVLMLLDRYLKAIQKN